MPLYTESELRQMLGQKPKYYLKDQGGWYLSRKRITIDECSTEWTHIIQEARAFTKLTTAAMTRNRLNLERQKSTIEVVEVYS